MPVNIASRIMNPRKAPSLRQRFLVAPLLGLVLLGLLTAIFTHELRQQNALLTQLVEEDMVAFEGSTRNFIDLSEEHVGLFDLLNSAPQSDEETLYEHAKRRLLAIHAATLKLREAMPSAHNGAAGAAVQRAELLVLIEAYRRAAISAVEMTTLNVALAPREITLANQRFAAMSRAFERLLDSQLDHHKQQAGDSVKRNRAKTLLVSLGGIGVAVLLFVLSVALSRVLARSLEAQIRLLDELGDPARAGSEAEGGDEVGRIGAAIAAFKHTQVDLRESEEHFRAVFEQASVGIALRGTDPRNSRWLKVNQKLCEMLGYTRDELLQLTSMDISPPEERDSAVDYNERLLRGDTSAHSRERRYLRKDGAVIWANVSAAVVSGPDGRPSYVMAVIQDISERKAQDKRIAALSRIHAVLSGINSTIVRVRDRQQLLDEACRIAVESGRFTLAWIGKLDHGAHTLVPVAWHGLGSERAAKLVLAVGEGMAEGGSLAAQAIRDRRAAISNDVAHDPRLVLQAEMAAHGLGSAVVLPLLVSGEVSGTLTLVADSPGFFDGEEMKLLQELAGDISFSLEHIEKSEQLEFLAHHDPLTGLANTALFQERLEQQVTQARAARRGLGVFVLDIERFKTINDTLGRQSGDELLRQVAARLVGLTDQASRFARVGADRFAILVPGVQSEDEVARFVAQRIEQNFDTAFRIRETELRVAVKVGVALYPDNGENAVTLFRNAEAALKRAKADGDRIRFFAPQMTERVAENLKLENKLRVALEEEQFVLHYQPKVDLETRRIVGVEALIRWQSPELGLVPPMKFIPLLEETGLILQVGKWALTRATLDHRNWVEQHLHAPRVAVNVSAIQLRQKDFVGIVERAIDKGVAPTGIDLEVTESLMMDDVADNVRKLTALRDLGMQIAIDDFGTGYSSLGYLAKLPVQALKIDRSFIIAMLKDSDTMTLVQTMISLAHALRLSVVAEGVETEEQAKVLRLLRCDQMQGYLFSKPLPLHAMTALLAARPVDRIAAAIH